MDRKIVGVLKKGICLLLSLQTLLAPIVLPHARAHSAQPSISAVAANVDPSAQQISQSRTKLASFYHQFLPYEQGIRWTTKEGTTQEVLFDDPHFLDHLRAFDLTHFDPKRDLRVTFDSVLRELRFDYVRFDQHTEQYAVVLSHFLKGIETPHKQAQPYLMDEEHVLDLGGTVQAGHRKWIKAAPELFVLLDNDGIRANSWKRIGQTVFRQPMELPMVRPNMEGAPFTNIHWVHPKSSLILARESEYHVGDLAVTVAGDTVGFDRDEFKSMIADAIQGYLFALYFIAPDVERLNEILSIYKGSQLGFLESIQNIPTSEIKEENIFDLIAERAASGIAHFNQEKASAGLARQKMTEELRQADYPHEPSTPWQETVLQRRKDHERAWSQHAQLARETQERVQKKEQGRLWSLVERWATAPVILGLGAMGLDAVNHARDNHEATLTMVNTMSMLFGWTQSLPLVGYVFKEIGKNHELLLKEHWIFTKIIAVCSAVLVARPLFLHLAHWWSERKKHNYDEISALPYYSIKLLLKLNRPFQVFIYERLFRQKLIREVLDQGLSPSEYQDVWHKPWASEGEVAQKRHRIQNQIAAEKKHAEHALFLAALVVARENKMDPATLLQAFHAHEEGVLDRYLELLEKMDAHQIEQQHQATALIMKELTRMQEQGIHRVDAATIEKYQKILNQVTRQLRKKSNFINARLALSWNVFERFASKIWPAVIYGKHAYDFNRKYGNMHLDPETLRTGHNLGSLDYRASTTIAALTNYRWFINTYNLAIDQAGRMVVDNGVYNIVNATWALDLVATATADKAVDSVLPMYSPLQKLEGVEGLGHKQNIFEAAWTTLKQVADGKRTPYLDRYLKYIENSFLLLQARVIMGAVPKMVLWAIIALAAQEVGGHEGRLWMLATAIAMTIPKELSMALGKFSIFDPLGYAAPYPYVTEAVAHQEAVTLENVRELNEARVLIHSDNINEIHLGLDRLRQLWKKNGKSFPKQWRDKGPSEFSADEARRLYAYLQARAPIPTIPNHAFQKIANGVAAFISTAIIVKVSEQTLDQNINGLDMLFHSFQLFTSSYLGASVVRAGFHAVHHCASVLSRKK